MSADGSKTKSVFADVELGPPIEVFKLTQAFRNDTDPRKVNLGVGAYRTEEGNPWVLPIVRSTEIKIASTETNNHEYLAVLGNDEFCGVATALLLGANSEAVTSQRAFGVQTLSGTGALRIGADFLVRHLKRSVFYYSDPTWENHRKVFLDAGFQTPCTYRYWDQEKRGLNITGLLEDLERAPAGAVIILHACAHNPTGCDPTKDQWKQIADLMERKKLFPFFDSAYQGFASGDPDVDAWAVRYFVDRGFEILCAQSFAKNFGLYCERAGNLVFVQNSPATTAAVKSQVTWLVRGMYSNPPAFGSRIVADILKNEDAREQWMGCIRSMSSRIKKMREELHGWLKRLETPGTWDHITSQIGMFSYTCLNEAQVRVLVDKYHIYLLKSGRINMCGLNCKNVEYVARAIHAVVTTVSSDLSNNKL